MIPPCDTLSHPIAAQTESNRTGWHRQSRADTKIAAQPRQTLGSQPLGLSWPHATHLIKHKDKTKNTIQIYFGLEKRMYSGRTPHLGNKRIHIKNQGRLCFHGTRPCLQSD